MSNLSPAASALLGKLVRENHKPMGGTFDAVFNIASAMVGHCQKDGEWERARNYREVAAHLEPVALAN